MARLGVGKGGRVARVRVLSEDEKAKIATMTSYTQMEAAERKRQFAALDRRMRDAAGSESLPPGLLQQYQAAFGNSEKKFELVSLFCHRG